MKSMEKRQVEMDLTKIFLTPPNTRKEKITLLVMLVATFVIFFGPICFSAIPPVKAVLLACMPSFSLLLGLDSFCSAPCSGRKILQNRILRQR